MNDDLHQTCKAAVRAHAKQRADELLDDESRFGFEIENEINRTLEKWVTVEVSEYCREGIDTGSLVHDRMPRLRRNS